MGDIREEVFKLRRRVAELEGVSSMAQIEMSKLKEIVCPNCNGKRQFSREENGTIFNDLCEVCDGTGYAAGSGRY